METNKKCLITRYDETIKEPPYLTIIIDEMEVMEPKKDDLGEEFYRRLVRSCKSKGYNFKFYTTTKNEDYDYEVVVY